MQAQMRRMLDDRLFESAEKLGALAMCASKTSRVPEPSAGPGSHAETLTLYADALFGKDEYRHALHYYKQSLQRRKVGPHMATFASASSSPFFSASSPPPNQQHSQNPHSVSFENSFGSAGSGGSGTSGSPSSPSSYAAIQSSDEA